MARLTYRFTSLRGKVTDILETLKETQEASRILFGPAAREVLNEYDDEEDDDAEE